MMYTSCVLGTLFRIVSSTNYVVRIVAVDDVTPDKRDD